LSTAAKSYITMSPTGRTIVSDLWKDLGICDQPSKTRMVLIDSASDPSQGRPIGLVGYGILYGEEPQICGRSGTGAIYVHGCAFRCKTCYQPEFFASTASCYSSVDSLAALMLDFQKSGAHSITIVIGSYSEPIYQSLVKARRSGLSIPIVYKFAGVLPCSLLDKLSELVDIFVPDLKALSPELHEVHGLSPQYGASCLRSIRYLQRQQKTVIVRHLLVPTFAGYLVEVQRIIDQLDLVHSEIMLSLLIHYQDPITKVIHSVDASGLAFIRSLKTAVPIYYQGGDRCEFLI
jgi:uncharacterized Fe-S radical SAM superfamily protein PflX